MTSLDMWKLVDPPKGTVAPTLQAEIDALQIQKNKALSMIALSVKDSVIPHIASITEPEDCWNTLKNLYASKNNSRKLMLKRKLANLKMQEGTPMPVFLQELRELLNDFACIGETLADSEVVEQVLMALPESFEGMVNTLTYQSTLPTIAELTVILLQDDQRREIRTKKNEGEALLVKGEIRTRKSEGEILLVKGGHNKPASHRKDSTKPLKKIGDCHYCGSREHWMRSCPELAAELKRRKADRQAKAIASVNFLNNFEGDPDSDNDSCSDGEPAANQDLGVNVTELNLASHLNNSPFGDWYIDSGASKHVTGQREALSRLGPGNRSRVSTAGGEILHVEGKGIVEIPTTSGAIKFESVLYVPGITKNLLSVGSITDSKRMVLFDSKRVWILDESYQPPCASQILATGHRNCRNGLYRFRPPEVSANAVNSFSDPKFKLDLLIWHKRLGHPSHRVLITMQQQSKVIGLPPLSFAQLPVPVCPACQLGKQSRAKVLKRPSGTTAQASQVQRSSSIRAAQSSSFAAIVSAPSAGDIRPASISVSCTGSNGFNGVQRAMEPLALLHSDLCGPLANPSSSRSRYILTITDDFSRFSWIFFLKKKSETILKFRHFKSMVELQMPFKIKALRSDRGGEYIAKYFSQFCEDFGIIRQFTQVYTPHLNGIAERKIGVC